jgi:hypothetical protein
MIVNVKLYEVWMHDLIVSLIEYGVICSIFRLMQRINWGCQLIWLTHFLYVYHFEH